MQSYKELKWKFSYSPIWKSFVQFCLVVPRVEIREHIKGANNLISSLNFNFFSLSLRKMNFSSSVIL